MSARHKHGSHAKSGSTGPQIAAQPIAASDDPVPASQEVCAEDIRLLAYGKWESAGKPAGDGVPFWVEAERELLHGG